MLFDFFAAAALFARALTLRCPNCGARGIVASWFKLGPACPRCRLRPERGESDYFLPLTAMIATKTTAEAVPRVGCQRSAKALALARTSISTTVTSLSDIDAAPVVDSGRVYAVGQGGRMVSLELISGQRQWELNIAGISTPWVAGEWVYVVTDDAKLIAVARSNGKIRSSPS